jgi:crotonobetainyl-CoA:carnitine CoA-transferase CaiB-like acyl-CoA transferase
MQANMSTLKPLRGVRVVSLALNLPGPAALMRLAHMGARCTKVNPPAGDPMAHYTPTGYALLHQGVRQKTLDLKSAKGQVALHQLLANAEVLLTSFRPSALRKLGLGWKTLHARYPSLSLIEVVGAPGPLAEVAGHDLTYQAEVDLVDGMALPPSLFADMGGALMASEATLKALIARHTTGQGSRHEVALSDAAAWLALPRQWRMTTPDGAVGGAGASLCGPPVRSCASAGERPDPRPVQSVHSARHCGFFGPPNAPPTRATRHRQRHSLDDPAAGFQAVLNPYFSAVSRQLGAQFTRQSRL